MNANPHASDTPDSVSPLFPGPRSLDPLDFAAALADGGPRPAEPVWTELFGQTSGWVIAGQAVVDGAISLGLDLDTVDPSRFPDILSTAVLARIRNDAVDSEELRLAHLLSFVHTISPQTIALTAEAIALLGVPEMRTETDSAVLTARLLGHGLLRPGSGAEGTRYELSPVLRSILQRIYDSKDGHSAAKSRRALGTVLAKALKSPASFHSDHFDEILLQSADNGHWDVLAQVWAERGHAMFLDHLEATTSAFSLVPEDRRQNSAVLAEALSAAEQVTRTRIRIGSDDPRAVLSEVSFECSDVPSLSSRASQIENGAFTVDDIVAMSIASMQNLRLLGEPSKGLAAAEQGWRYVTDRERFSRSPSRLSDARFHLERGITALAAGDVKSSTQLLRRSILVGEATTSPAPDLLGPAYVYSALANIASGSGNVTDGFLQRFDDLRRSIGFTSPRCTHPYALARMIRAIDRLDLETAERHFHEVPDPALGHTLWIPAMLYTTILGILQGQAPLAEKRLSQVMETNGSNYADESVLSGPAHLSRMYVHLAQGHTHLAQTELMNNPSRSPEFLLAKARFHLTVGDHHAVDELARRVQYQKAAQIRVKASIRAVQAASLKRSGGRAEANAAFIDSLEYCRIATTLQPLAFIPKPIRDRFVKENSNAPQWDLLAQSFGDPELTGTEVMHRLLELGETLLEGSDHAQLDRSQLHLLTLLDGRSTVTEISEELGLAEGTVKNKLSKLYKRLGVRGWKAAVAYGYEHGYLPQQQ